MTASSTRRRRALQKADKVFPGWSETEKARNEIAQLRTPEGQLKTQLDRARFAIEHDDRAAAEKALAEAERLNAQAPQIAELRQALKQAEQKDTHRGDRVTELLTKMREDICTRRPRGRGRRSQCRRARQCSGSGDPRGPPRARPCP